MTKLTPITAAPMDMAKFEAAVVRDGAKVDVVFRRRGVAVLDRLTPQARLVVDAYTATAEAVAAGGARVSNPEAAASGGSQGGAPSREGRQSAAVDQVSFVRLIERAVGRFSIRLGKRDPIDIPTLDLWRAVCLGDQPLEAYMNRAGIAVNRRRCIALRDGFIQAADRAADAIGQSKNPLT